MAEKNKPKEEKPKEKMIKESDVNKAIEGIAMALESRMELIDLLIREFSEYLSNESLHMLGAYKKALKFAIDTILGE